MGDAPNVNVRGLESAFRLASGNQEVSVALLVCYDPSRCLWRRLVCVCVCVRTSDTLQIDRLRSCAHVTLVLDTVRLGDGHHCSAGHGHRRAHESPDRSTLELPWLVPAFSLDGAFAVHCAHAAGVRCSPPPTMRMNALLDACRQTYVNPPPRFGDILDICLLWSTVMSTCAFQVGHCSYNHHPCSHVSVEFVCAFVCLCPHDTWCEERGDHKFED